MLKVKDVKEERQRKLMRENAEKAHLPLVKTNGKCHAVHYWVMDVHGRLPSMKEKHKSQPRQ